MELMQNTCCKITLLAQKPSTVLNIEAVYFVLDRNCYCFVISKQIDIYFIYTSYSIYMYLCMYIYISNIIMYFCISLKYCLRQYKTPKSTFQIKFLFTFYIFYALLCFHFKLYRFILYKNKYKNKTTYKMYGFYQIFFLRKIGFEQGIYF